MYPSCLISPVNETVKPFYPDLYQILHISKQSRMTIRGNNCFINITSQCNTVQVKLVLVQLEFEIK